jgi:hypothetical protein
MILFGEKYLSLKWIRLLNRKKRHKIYRRIVDRERELWLISPSALRTESVARLKKVVQQQATNSNLKFVKKLRNTLD